MFYDKLLNISFKFTLKYTIISRLHVSVFNDHRQAALSEPNQSYIYVKTLGKITSWQHDALQSHSALHTTHMPLYSLTLHCTQHTCRSTVSLCTQHTCRSTVSFCTAHNTHAALRLAATSPNLYNDIILPNFLT